MNSNVVYKITNTINGKIYIGISNDFPQRMRSHESKAFSHGKEHGLYFYQAIRKYGWDNFTKEVLESNLSREDACNREQFYIEQYKSNFPNYGYNLTKGGDGAQTFSKLKYEEVLEIISTIKNTNLCFSTIAEKFKVSYTTISLINSGTNWHNIELDYPLRPYGISSEIWDNIINDLINSKTPIREIAKNYGLSYETVRKFNSGQNHNGYYHSYPIRKKGKSHG